LDPRLRFVMMDDRSLEKIQRPPTFGEWQRIAAALFDAGYERVVLPIFPQFASEVGTLAPRHPRGELIAGVVVYPGAANPRAGPVGEVPAQFFIAAHADTAGASLQPAAFVLTPHPSVFPLVDHFASVNVVENDAFPVAYATPAGDVLPIMGVETV